MAAGTLKSTQTNALARVYVIGKAQYTMKTDLLFKKQGEVLLKRLKIKLYPLFHSLCLDLPWRF